MKKTVRKGFIYFRYALPLVLAAVLVILMLFPVYRFVTTDAGVGDAISLLELLGNAFSDTREYIFKSGDKAVPTMDFSVTLFAVVICAWVLFFVGVIFAFLALYVMLEMNSKKNISRMRIMLVTLTVNRVGICIWQALMLPIFLVPKIMPLLYENILAYRVELICEPFDMLWAALALYALTAAVIFMSKKYESLSELNIYRLTEIEVQTHDGYSEEIESEGDEPIDAYEAMVRRAREEQTERILKLLNKDKDSDGEA